MNTAFNKGILFCFSCLLLCCCFLLLLVVVVVFFCCCCLDGEGSTKFHLKEAIWTIPESWLSEVPLCRSVRMAKRKNRPFPWRAIRPALKATSDELSLRWQRYIFMARFPPQPQIFTCTAPLPTHVIFLRIYFILIVVLQISFLLTSMALWSKRVLFRSWLSVTIDSFSRGHHAKEGSSY